MKYVLIALMLCFQSVAFAERPPGFVNPFDPPSTPAPIGSDAYWVHKAQSEGRDEFGGIPVRKQNESAVQFYDRIERIKKADEWKHGGRHVVFWPVAVMAGGAVAWSAIELASILIGFLKLISRNTAWRVGIGGIWWACALFVCACVISVFITSWGGMRIRWLLAYWVVFFPLAIGLSRLTRNLHFLCEAIFAESTDEGRYRYLRASRELAGIKDPIWVENYFSKRTAREHIIREKMKGFPRDNSKPQFMPIVN